MTKRHRSFETKVRTEKNPPEELSFDLDSQTFVCRPQIPGAVVLEFVAAADEGGGRSAGQILSFFKRALPEEAYEKFEATIYDPDTIVEMETLTEIVAFLIEEYTARPTTESKP